MKLVKHEDITEDMKSVLGDSVEYAYTTYDEDDVECHGMKWVLRHVAAVPLDFVPSYPTIVKMKGMKPIKFWVSEWGGIEQFDDENNIPA
jgi:hypothetical protein